MILNYH
jgi:NAD(P)-dependent dehydrogenase (short-subunit alcohol dehydrogenase family)